MANSSFPFDCVLIANRGEIAVRIIGTLRKLGLRSVVVYHEVDARAPAVALADQAIAISGRTPVAAYLDGEQIITAARSAGAARCIRGTGSCRKTPTSRARSKPRASPSSARRRIDRTDGRQDPGPHFVARNGFPVAPSAIEEDDPATFVERARAIGAPLLVKPSAGGGGKGMRIVRTLPDWRTRLRSAQRRSALFRRRPALCRAIY